MKLRSAFEGGVMPRNFKLAILRARHDAAWPLISDQSCIDLIMTGPQSALRYWSDTTHGHFDFLGSSLMPWVEISLAPPDTDRGKQIEVALKALRDANPGHDPVAGFDGLLLLTHPGGAMVDGAFKGWDGGAGGLPDGRGYAVVSTGASSSVFICHELGHVLGFEHSYGLDNNGTDWAPKDDTIIFGPEYGSPHDIMSAEAFGSRWLGTGPFWSGAPAFLGDALPGDWPTQNARWRGPHLARGSLHRWLPEAFAPERVVDRSFPGAAEKGLVRLRPPEAARGASLLILYPPGEPASGAGRVYVEYRPALGWDRGLKLSGTNLAQAGVVVHKLETVASVGERVWYRGCIPLYGLDRDVQVPGTQLMIAIDQFSDYAGDAWVDVAYSLVTAPRAGIRSIRKTETTVGESGLPRLERNPCGEIVARVTFVTSTIEVLAPDISGFGGSALPPTPPTITWQVGGTVVTGPAGTVDVSFDGGVYTLEYGIDPISSELSLTSRGGEKVEAMVTLTADDAGAGPTLTATTPFRARGWFEGYTPDSLPAVARCIRRFENVDFPIDIPVGPPGPVEINPVDFRIFVDRVRGDGLIFDPRTRYTLDRLDLMR